MCGDKYMVLRADTRSLYGKKAGTGVICVKTGKVSFAVSPLARPVRVY